MKVTLTPEEGRVIQGQLHASNHELCFKFDCEKQRFSVHHNEKGGEPTGTYVSVPVAIATVVARYNGVKNEVHGLEKFLTSIGAIQEQRSSGTLVTLYTNNHEKLEKILGQYPINWVHSGVDFTSYDLDIGDFEEYYIQIAPHVIAVKF